MLGESLRGVVSQHLLKNAQGNGRVACIEILLNNSAVANLIREGKTFQIPSVMQTSIKQGMLPLEMHLKQLVDARLIKAEDAAKVLHSMGKKPTMFAKVG
jgi:twitching motility protein PilT